MEQKNKKVCFFGASVTRQPKGMVQNFQELNKNTDTYFFAYGGNRIKDAGVCHLNKIIKTHPDYCFVDWFSGQMPLAPTAQFLEMCMDAIVYKLLEIKCIPIFLLLYRHDSITINDILPKRAELYSLIESYCKKYNIPCLSLYKNKRVINLQADNQLLIDVVHTTPSGSALYGELISEYFNKVLNGSNPVNSDTIIKPLDNYLCDIKEINFEKTITKSFKIIGNGRLIGININAGPHSGIVDLFHANGAQERINTWDMYCYYTRNIVSFVNTYMKDWIELKINKENFDRSACNKECPWEKFDKELRCMSIFYTGEILEIQS